MRDRSRIGLAAALVIAIALTGCSNNAGGGGQGGVLRIGTSSGISSLNPFVGFNQDDYATWMYIYPTLVQYDTTKPNYDFAPNFAQSWDLSKDGLELTLDAIDDLPDDASAEDMASIDKDFSTDDKKKTDAFTAYLEKTCPDIGA